MTRHLAVAVSRCAPVTVTGTFQRHTGPRVNSLRGSAAGGRWGPPGAYSVLYLGRPTASVTIEAYRHLVDDVEGMTGATVGPRSLWTVEVGVTRVLDLRDPGNRAEVGLTPADLASPTDDYAACQRVAQAAYQLQLSDTTVPTAHRARADTNRMSNGWEPGKAPAVRSARHFFCYFCGQQTAILAFGDDPGDTGRVEVYCENTRCAARETVVLIRRDNTPETQGRGDVQVLRQLDRLDDPDPDKQVFSSGELGARVRPGAVRELRTSAQRLTVVRVAEEEPDPD